MTPQEKTSKIADFEKQLRKIRRVQKFLEKKPYRNASHKRFMNRIKRVWGLSTNYFMNIHQLCLIQSQQCK